MYLERIKSLEASREIIQKKLKKAFVEIERIDLKSKELDEANLSALEKLKSLMAKVDVLTDNLIRLENSCEELKKIAHFHKVIR